MSRAGAQRSQSERLVESGSRAVDDVASVPASGRRRMIGDYALHRQLGSGAMGEVWLARHVVTGVVAAVKVLHPHVATREKVQRFFAREQRAIARLAHPHIVSLHAVGPSYLATAFVDGHDLARRLQTPIDPATAVRYVVQVASALAHAHAHGVIHRDVKPSNILLDARGNAFLADFGLAAIVDDGDALHERAGTPAFMAPEQLRGELSPAIDQYALGRTLLEMLAGGSVPADSSEAIAQLPTSLPPALIAVVRRATARASQDRWPSMEAFAGALVAVDLDDYPPPLRLAPEIRVHAPFAWCIQPTASAALTPEIMRADYRLSDLETAGVLSGEACATFRDATGYADIAWSLYGHQLRLGPVTHMSALARASDSVVLMHGMFCARDDWRDVAAAVCRNNAQALVLAPDLYGCGDSRFVRQRPAEEHVSPRGTAQSVLSLLDLLSLRDLPTVLVGHSISATAILSMRDADLGERVSRVAITPVFTSQKALARASNRVLGGLLALAFQVPGLRARCADIWRARRDVSTLSDAARERVVLEIKRASPALLSALFAQFGRATPAGGDDLRRCAVVVGEDDPFAPPAQTIELLARHGFSTDDVRRILGNGHHPHYENAEHPEETARCIDDIVRLIDTMLVSSREGSPLSTEMASTVLGA